MKMENLVKLFIMAIDLFTNWKDSIEDSIIYSREKEKKMTEEETQIFATLVFSMFTLMLVVFVCVIPTMLYMNYSLLTIIVALLIIGFALSSTIAVLLRKYYWLFASNLSSFFQKYSLSYIGLKESSQRFFTSQLKIFKLVRGVSLCIIGCYLLAILAPISSFNFLSTFFQVLLLLITLGAITIMAIDGILMYSICLLEIGIRLLDKKVSKELCKSRLKAICISPKNIFTKKQKYTPKRLATTSTPISGNIFSLKH